MLKLNFLIHGLVLVAQVGLVYSAGSGVCSKCKDILNQPQCDSYHTQFGSCKWGSSCGDAPASSASTSAASASISASASASAQPSCASQTSSCTGSDGSNSRMICYQDSGSSCKSVDASQVCTSFTTSGQCAVSPVCTWSSTGSASSAGSCAPSVQCTDSKRMDFCTVSYLGLLSGQACKWTPFANATNSTASTAGTCANGQASDLSTSYCEGPHSIFFTYNSASSSCTQCTDSFSSNSGITKTVIVAILFALFSL